jgi:phosphonoacetaldehyde hydrolase
MSTVAQQLADTEIWHMNKESTRPWSSLQTRPGVAVPGGLHSAVLDWSGTVLDNWVTSVSQAFAELWRTHAGIEITMAEARQPMGLDKALHNEALSRIPRIVAAWQKRYGRAIRPEELADLFRSFIPIQLRWLERPSVTNLIPGTLEAVSKLRTEYGLNIGVTTGFQRTFVDVLLRASSAQGFSPDFNVAADDVLGTRPRPFPDMMLANIIKLKSPHMAAVLKVDDTRGGIGEGLSAGCWTCGLSHTSVYMNIDSHEHGASLSQLEFDRRGAAAREILLRSGAHYVVNDIRGVPAVVDLINRRLQAGHLP